MDLQSSNNELISKIETDVAQIKLQLINITEMLTLLTKSSDKLNNHINFVEETYDTLKKPLNYMKDTVNRITFRNALTNTLNSDEQNF
jgi:archaellum component FlaC